MLIGIVGPACSGKQTVARLLVEREGFRQLSIQSAKNATASSSLKKEHHQEGEPSVFANANELLAFVTTRWQERFVVCAVESIVTVELLQQVS
jgi:cytidylate kinase